MLGEKGPRGSHGRVGECLGPTSTEIRACLRGSRDCEGGMVSEGASGFWGKEVGGKVKWGTRAGERGEGENLKAREGGWSEIPVALLEAFFVP